MEVTKVQSKKTSYHGDNDGVFYVYPEASKAPNFGKWDFADTPDVICTNFKTTTEQANKFICQGHEIGDCYWPSYHGNAYNNREYQISPYGPCQSDDPHTYYEHPCDNYKVLNWNLENGNALFACQGHLMTFHGDASMEHKIYIYGRDCPNPPNLGRYDFHISADFVCSRNKRQGNEQSGYWWICQGHSKGEYLHPSFHGDVTKGYAFWVVPFPQKIQTPQFEFRYMPCDNAKLIERKKTGVIEYHCLGHSLTYHGDPMRDRTFFIYPDSVVPPNLGIWDFVGNPDFVCSHKVQTTRKSYKCLGHSKGDHYPSYHGDPANHHRFRMIPWEAEFTNPLIEYRINPCPSSKFIQRLPDGSSEYECHGHTLPKI